MNRDVRMNEPWLPEEAETANRLWNVGWRPPEPTIFSEDASLTDPNVAWVREEYFEDTAEWVEDRMGWKRTLDKYKKKVEDAQKQLAVTVADEKRRVAIAKAQGKQARINKNKIANAERGVQSLQGQLELNEGEAAERLVGAVGSMRSHMVRWLDVDPSSAETEEETFYDTSGTDYAEHRFRNLVTGKTVTLGTVLDMLAQFGLVTKTKTDGYKQTEWGVRNDIGFNPMFDGVLSGFEL